MIRLYRDASLRAAQRLIELIEDPDGRVATLAAMTVYEKAWGKNFDPSTIKDQPTLRFDFKRLNLEELRFLRSIFKRGLVEMPADDVEQLKAAETVLEGKATEVEELAPSAAEGSASGPSGQIQVAGGQPLQTASRTNRRSG